ncbi:MAG: hypothetical protein ACLSVD_02945 [Eggerthellaceae bacterium]
MRTDIVADGAASSPPCGSTRRPSATWRARSAAELFDRIAAERGYLRQGVGVAALLRIAAKLEEDADYGSWQAETAGRIGRPSRTGASRSR